MTGSSPTLVWRKPALIWGVTGVVVGAILIASQGLLFGPWLPLANSTGVAALFLLFGLLWLGLGAALCALKGRGRMGLTRGDVIVCFPLAAFALIALLFAVGTVGAMYPLLPGLSLLSPVVAVAAGGGMLVIMWGIPGCAAAAWLFSHIAFRPVRRPVAPA